MGKTSIVTLKGTGQLNGPVKIKKVIEMENQMAQKFLGGNRLIVIQEFLKVHYSGVTIDPKNIGVNVTPVKEKQKKQTKKSKPDSEKKSIFTRLKNTVSNNSTKGIKKTLSYSNSEKEKVDKETFSLLKKITESVNIKDVDKVKNKIGNFNKGALRDVWDKIMELWNICSSPESEWSKKAVALGALVYTITTLDVVPDVIPGLGFIDDAAAILFAVKKLGIETVKTNKNENNFLEENINSEIIISKINILTSILSHCASSDNVFSEIEKKKINEIINLFVFSDEGIASKEALNKISIKRKELEVIIKNTLNNPTDLDTVIKNINHSKIEPDILYFYTYAIAFADGNINREERLFLDMLAKSLNIKDKRSIENKVI